MIRVLESGATPAIESSAWIFEDAILPEIEDFPAAKDEAGIDVVRRLPPFAEAPAALFGSGASPRDEPRARRRINGVGETGVADRSRL